MAQTDQQDYHKNLFSGYIRDPAGIGSESADALAELAAQYPYAQLISSFHARSVSGSDKALFEDALSKAALISPNRELLRRIIEDPESLVSAGDIHVVQTPSPVAGQQAVKTDIEAPATSEEPDPEARFVNEETPEPAESAEEPAAAEPAETGEAIADRTGMEELEHILAGDQPVLTDEPAKADQYQQVEDEDIAGLTDDRLNQDEPQEVQDKETDALDKLIRENVAAADYLSGEKKDAPQPPELQETVTSTPKTESKDPYSRVSKYDDDKMPYSFLWWLDKTRKEHTGNYQPYVSFKLDTRESIRAAVNDPLSNQIIENIFHLQSPVDSLDNSPRTIPFQISKRDDEIVEKFIREDPQIRATAAAKMDTENKARKSSEDNNDLVSETLAQIYIDQMLYHKAIETYRKLSLKFPEKSTYFADRILEIEKKIN